MITRLFSTRDTKFRKTQSVQTFQETYERTKTKLILFLAKLVLKDDHSLRIFFEKLFRLGILKQEERTIFESNVLSNFGELNLIPCVKDDISFPFQKQKLLGEGSFGKVYHCVHILDQKDYAIKCIENANEKDIKEIQILSDFHHPHIVRYFYSWIECHTIFLQMEYCSHTLRNYFMTEKVYDRLLFDEIVDGLDYIHSKGYIHFDLKPENIFLTETRQIKIGDFGYSKNFAQEKFYNPDLYEKTFYICKDDMQCHSSIDIYSLGLIMLEFFLPFCVTMMEHWCLLREAIQKPETRLSDEYLQIFLYTVNAKQKERLTTAEIIKMRL